jgi:hypothetical protein
MIPMHLPKLLPVAAIPVAIMRRFWKYSGMTATDVRPSRPLPMPVQMPCESKICQYSVLIEVIIIPNTSKNVPRMRIVRRYPASSNQPTQIPTIIVRKSWMDPIQAMAEADDVGRRVVT